MPAKSARSSKRTKAAKAAGKAASRRKANSKRLDRPFTAETLATARGVADQYQIVIESDEGHWYGRGLELPYVFGDGETPKDCVDTTREALTAAVAYMIEQGQTPPTPAKEGKRSAQVNVRLTAEEKAILEGTARRKGFEGLSDFMRAAALESAQ